MLPLSFHCELMLQSHLSLEARLHRMNLEAKEILFWALAQHCRASLAVSGHAAQIRIRQRSQKEPTLPDLSPLV